MRLFIAIELTSALQEKLTAVTRPWIAVLPEGSVRWVRPEGRHLTLKFLGEVPEERVGEIQAALLSAVDPIPGFPLHVGGFGTFPNLRHPRVLWVGVEDPTGDLARVQAVVEGAMVELGFDPERRAFHPHITLGRVGRRVRGQGLKSLASQLGEVQIDSVGEMKVGQIYLIRSELKPTGAEYTRILAAPLKGEARAG